MKKILLLVVSLSLGGLSQLSAQTLTGFGSGDLNPSFVFETPWTGVQSSTSISVTGVSVSGGGIFSTLTTPVTISNIGTQFLTLTAATPAVSTSSFTIQLTDSSLGGNTLTYQFTAAEFLSLGVGNPGIAFSGVLLDPLDVSSFTGAVTSYEINPSGLPGGTVSYRFDNLAFTATFVPEPSTYAMFGFGLFMLYVVYRRKANKLQTVRA
jgi:hypothetical protein